MDLVYLRQNTCNLEVISTKERNLYEDEVVTIGTGTHFITHSLPDSYGTDFWDFSVAGDTHLPGKPAKYLTFEVSFF